MTEQDISQKILDMLKPLSDADRQEVMAEVTNVYCEHCWNAHPKGGTCQCWNDE